MGQRGRVGRDDLDWGTRQQQGRGVYMAQIMQAGVRQGFLRVRLVVRL
jgi:hypothetical protein